HRSMALAIAACCATAAPCARADDAALQAEVEALRAELAALKAEVKQMQSARVAADTPPPAKPAASPAAVPASSTAQASAPAESTSLWGYGELNYNHPTGHGADAQADLRRAVIGFSH